MALGFEGPGRAFNGADVIIVQSTNGQCTVGDYWAQSAGEFRLDNLLGGDDDLLDATCAVSGREIVASFKRAATSVDPLDRDMRSEGFTNTILAWGVTSDVAIVSEKTSRLQINFYAARDADATEAYVISPPLPNASEGVPGVPPAPGAPPNANGDPRDGRAATITGETTLDADRKFTLSWELAQGSVTFTMEVDGEGFMGIGIPGTDKNMHLADIIVAVADGATCEVNDYWSETFARPTPDEDIGGQDSLTAKSCEVADGHMSATFTRSLVVPDEFDREIPAQGFSLIYAFHEAPRGMQYHGNK
ncbi:unnamed protein product, partial [Ostreobium quekettii]|eukprot:evm.model.scf_599.10 EVM.evm.TU.scf_599.10   scf_599:60114-61784(-)